MPRKPFFLTKSQIGSGISRWSWRIFQSSTMRHSSAVGPSRNAFSSAVSVIGGTARSFSQSGVPENSSASKPMVPALSASCSVADTLGRMPLILRKMGSISATRRSGGMLRPASTTTGIQASSCSRVNSGSSNSPCSMSVCQTSVATGQRHGPQPQRRPLHGEREYAIKQSTKNTGSAMVCRLSAAPKGAIPIDWNFRALHLIRVDVYVNFCDPRAALRRQLPTPATGVYERPLFFSIAIVVSRRKSRIAASPGHAWPPRSSHGH